jgi:ABC-type phosphate transport system substrate-binding protein
MNNTVLRTSSVIAGVLFSAIAMAADVVVIANKANENNVDKAFIVKAFTGEAKNWPDGGTLHLLDQADDSPSRTVFNTSVLGKNDSAVKAMWAQKIFSGKALPPKVVSSDEEVKKAVAANKNAIGYISAAAVDGSVKVIMK